LILSACHAGLALKQKGCNAKADKEIEEEREKDHEILHRVDSQEHLKGHCLGSA